MLQCQILIPNLNLNKALLNFEDEQELIVQENADEIYVTPSVLCPKQTTKPCHEHHVYVIKHVIKCVDQFLVT